MSDAYAPPPAGQTASPTPPPGVPVPGAMYGRPRYGGIPPVPVQVPSGLGLAAIVLACAMTLVQVIGLLMAPRAAEVMADAAASGEIYFNAATTAYDGLAFVGLPAGIAAYVVTCLWLYKSRTFAESVNPLFNHRRGAVWAWLGWWVPIVSFWFPYQVVRDVRSATSKRPMSGIGWWWAAWLVYFSFSRAADRTTLRTTPEANEVAANLLVPYTAIATVAMVVALILWIRVVREITSAQQERVATPSASEA